MIKVRYFGKLKDELQLSEESIEWCSGTTEDLLALLQSRNERWARALSTDNIFRVAVNDEIVFDPIGIQSGDVISILPPVTGG